jgi:iron(II)-dependent oxidoreductase
MGADRLAGWVEDARARTFALVADLSDEQLVGPRLAIVNPLGWEIGHVAWFQEKWVLRHAWGEPPVLDGGDALYDSSAIAHDLRWDLPLPSRAVTIDYLREVRRRVLDGLARRPLDEATRYFVTLTVFHEDMHDEAFAYTRQTLGYPAPPTAPTQSQSPTPDLDPDLGDAEIPGGTFRLGADASEPFVFDNEKWAHTVEVRPFAIARAATTQGEFARFVDDGGYGRRELWSDEGWRWRAAIDAAHPVYWRRAGAGWLRRAFDREVALEPALPMLHVAWYEAEAYCRWAGRRLPTEAEWEVAAATARAGDGFAGKRRFPWGDEPPDARRACLDGRSDRCMHVAALPDGDGAHGCRQMIGNAWEWTADWFLPYPGFVADPYKEYSAPWFGTHKVLRGGCLMTRARLLRNTWRNFYTPDRRDVWSGFRTCR